MQEVSKNINELNNKIEQAIATINLDRLIAESKELKEATQSSKFWDDPVSANSTMKKLADVEKRVNTWEHMKKSSQDLVELAKLNAGEISKDLEQQCATLSEEFDLLKREVKLSGPHDEKDAIVEIHAGAGGTDAQDWAEMLLRMYIRWAESNNHKATIVAKSSGEEAGIKSATLEISGEFVYGNLKGEDGVHRLVRLSPYNSDNLRQTSFAKVSVIPKVDKPESVNIDDKDLKIDVYRAGGHGGQSVNTTDSAVRITHIPTGITVSIQNERSQQQNKETALTILRSRLVVMMAEQHQEKIEELKGPNQSAEWGNQIRSYVLHPYKQVKDTRTKYETTDVQKVLDGDLHGLIDAYQEQNLS